MTFLRKADILKLRYCENCIADIGFWVLTFECPYALKKIWNAFHNMKYYIY